MNDDGLCWQVTNLRTPMQKCGDQTSVKYIQIESRRANDTDRR